MSELNPALHITTIGSGEHTLVFLHGLLGQGKNLATAAKALSDIATSLLVDVPNHGLSAWTEEFEYRDIADFIADELSRRGALDKPVVLIGHSMGGKIAMCLALDHPELVDKLCVVDISPVSYQHAEYFAGLMDAMAELDLTTLDNRRQADERLADKIPDTTHRSFVEQNLHHVATGPGSGSWIWRCNLKLLRRELSAISDFPDFSGQQWSGPTLWIRGANSEYVLPEDRQTMEELFPHTRLATVADASHWVHADQPEVFAELLRRFITE